jgi:TonB family protein
VQVGLIVTAGGCVRIASVFASSGYESLDRAAVDHVAAMRFLPAEQDGVAVERTSAVPIAFKLSELHPAQAAVPAQ